MPTPGQRIDPLSIRYTCAGRTYRIGLRVMTPECPATVTGFDPTAEDGLDIGVRLDGTGKTVYTDWRYAEPQEEPR